MKVRLNLPFELISHQAGVDVATVSRCFWKTIDALHRKIGFMVRWPERETLNETLPAIFKLHFPRLTGIMDCFEIFIDRPKNLKARAEVYSNYKKCRGQRYSPVYRRLILVRNNSFTFVIARVRCE